jgi:hypothetical protein
MIFELTSDPNNLTRLLFSFLSKPLALGYVLTQTVGLLTLINRGALFSHKLEV